MNNNEIQKVISQMRVGKAYVIEWNDAENYHGWYEDEDLDEIAKKSEEPVITYGVYKGKSGDGLYISVAQSGKEILGSPKSNIKKITVPTIKAIHAIDTKDNLTNMFRATFVIFTLIFATAVYFMFNPTTQMVENVTRSILNDYEVEIIVDE